MPSASTAAAANPRPGRTGPFPPVAGARGVVARARRAALVAVLVIGACARLAGATTFMESGSDATFGIQMWTGTGLGGTAAITSDATAHNGPRALKFASGGNNNCYLYKDAVLADAGRRASLWFRFDALPTTAAADIIAIKTGAGLAVASLKLNTNGKLRWDASTDGTATLSVNTWYRLSVAWTITNASTNSFRCWVGGTADIAATNLPLANTSGTRLQVGWASTPTANANCWVDDVYVDDFADLTDIGDVRVTAKLPNAVNNNAFNTTGGTGAVNERGIGTANNKNETRNNIGSRQDYNLQAANVGDVDISGASVLVLAHHSWIWAGLSSGSGTCQLTVDGSDYPITVGASAALFDQIVNSTAYPSAANAIGMVSVNANKTTFLYECGAEIAYYPSPANGIWDGGGADNNWSTANNWTNNTLPTVADVVTFRGDVSTKSCTVDASATPYAKGISVTGGYTGTVTQSNPVYVMRSTGFSMYSGTWTCNSYLYTPSFTQPAGTFNGTGTLYLIGASGSLSATSALPNLEVEGIDSGLIGYWKLDEASGAVCYDWSGNGYDGTYTGTTGQPVADGTIPALGFRNTTSHLISRANNQYVSIPLYAGAFDLPGAYTLSGWIRATSFDANFGSNLFEKSQGNSGYWMYLADGSSNSVHYLQHRDGTTIKNPPGSAASSTSTWYHCVGQWDGTTVRTWRNAGSPLEVAWAVGLGANGKNLALGGNTTWNSESINGNLDDCRIYNRALSEAEVYALQAGFCGDATFAATFTLSGNVAVAGNVKIWGGTLALAGNTLDVKGSFACYGKLDSTGTVSFTGTTAAQTIRSGEARFGGVTIAGSGAGAWTLQDALRCAGTLTISGGAFATGNFTVRCGSLDQSAGTFTIGTAKIVMESATGGTIRSATTIPDLRIENPTETGLAGYWKFDALTGLTARDCSNTGNTATFKGGAMHASASLPGTSFANDGCATFDGVNDWIDCGTGATLNVASGAAFAVTGWVKTSESWGTVVSLRSSSTDVPVIDLDLGYDGVPADTLAGGLTAVVRDDANTIASLKGTVVNDGAWHAFALQRATTGSVTLFVDGAPAGRSSTTATGAITTDYRCLGVERRWVVAGADATQLDPDHQYLAGQVDDVRFYQRALSFAEIRNLANGRYANGASGGATTTIATAGLAATALQIDAGTLATGTQTLTVANLFAMRDGNGAYSGGSLAQTFNGGITMYGGTFTGGTGSVACNGDFTQSPVVDAKGNMPQSGGVFTAPSTTMTITGNVVHGGTFAGNGGTVQLAGTVAGKTLTGVPRSGGLAASYYNTDLSSVNEDDWRLTRAFTGQRVETTVNQPGADFGTTTERDAWGISYDAVTVSNGWQTFSVQWDGWITVPTDGTAIKTRSDDGSRLWLDLNHDGAVQPSEWGSNVWNSGQPAATLTLHPNVPKGTYRIRIQYQEQGGGNELRLLWDDAGNGVLYSGSDYIVPSNLLTPISATSGCTGLSFANLQVTGSGTWAINDDLVASGTITCTAGTLSQGTTALISAGGLTVNGGTFTGSGAATSGEDITVSGAVLCSSGTLTSTRSALDVAGDFTVNGSGTFTHNSGTIELRPSATRTFTCTQALWNLRLNDGLVAYWPMEDAASPSADVTGRGHDAIWQNGPSATSATLPPVDAADARALSLDGTSQWALPKRNRDFALSQCTIAAWAYVRSSIGWGSNRPIFDFQARNIGTGYTGFTLETLNANQYTMTCMVSGGAQASAIASGLSADRWYHVAGTFDGSTSRIYIDGQEWNSSALAGSLKEQLYARATIGRNEYTQANWFPGYIDDLRVYDRALSRAEIQRLGMRHDPGAYLNTVNLGSTIDVNGDVTLLSGRLSCGSNSMTVAGSWADYGAAFAGGTGTVTFDGGAAGKSIRCGDQPFNHLSITGAGTWACVDQLRVDGNFLLNNATTGAFTAPSTKMVVKGNFTVTAGTFSHNNGTVIMRTMTATGGTLSCAQAFKHLVFTDGLIARWAFEESSSPSLDTSGWGHHATWEIAPTSDAANKPTLFEDNTRGMVFDGANTYLSVIDDWEFQPPSDLTIACWLNLGAGSNLDEGGIFGRMGNVNLGASAQQRGYQLMTTGNLSELRLRVNQTPYALDWGNVNYSSVGLNGWHHVAATVDAAGNWIQYIDGVVAANPNYGAGTFVTPPDGVVWIGRMTYYRGGWHPTLNGKLDDLRFYDRALGANEVKRLASGRETGAGAATFTLGSAVTIAGDLTVGSGTLDLNTRAVGVAGNFRCMGALTGTTSTLTFNGTGQTATVLSGNQSLNNVVVAGSGSTWTVADAFKAGGTFTQSASTFAGAARPITIGGDVAFNGGTFQSTTDELTAGGAFADNGGGLFVANPGIVRLTASSAKALNVAAAFNHLWIASGGDTGMVARFRLDEAHARVAIDDVGGLIATYSGTPTPSSSTPTMWASDPYCLDFTGPGAGQNDYVSLPVTAALDALNLGSCSFSAWVYPRSVPAGAFGSGADGYGIIYRKGCGIYIGNNGRFILDDQLSDGSWVASVGASSAHSLSAWHHVCGVIDAAARVNTLYVDGAYAGSASYAVGAKDFGSAPWTVGALDVGSGMQDYADCLIDDVRLYGRALGASEAAALATAGIDASNGTATISLGGPLNVDGDLVLESGVLAAGANQVNAAGAWRNLLGNAAFTSSGTVVLDGASQQLYGSTTFNHLSKTAAGGSTLTLPINECQTVTGTLTLSGSSGASLLNVYSSSPGARAKWQLVGATRAVSNVVVRDQHNYVLPVVIPPPTPAGCTDAGNNHWWFGGRAAGGNVLVGAPGID